MKRGGECDRSEFDRTTLLAACSPFVRAGWTPC
jgi:hypothetical protein